ncbi:MAG: tyrosine-type recombinase/integrase [Prolixibacteraceae bacterium]|nr:tyrosine-type recombinase/integrase [Prolixibacteraceae bacterium]
MKNIKCVIRKNLKRKDNTQTIYLRYTYNRRYILFAVNNVDVENKYWNKEAGRVRKSNNYELKNQILDEAERDFEKIVLQVILQKKEPTLLNVKTEFYKAKNIYQSDEAKPKKQDEKKFLKDFQAFIDEKENNDEVGSETIKTYKTTKAKLTHFQEQTNYFLHYDTINNDFYFQFLKYLREKGLVDNSVDKHIKNLKLFMKYALSNEKHNNNLFHTFKRTKAKAEFVVLDELEIQKLLYDYEPETTYHKYVRDTFVLGCSTGLRFGDLTNLTTGNFLISRDKMTNKIIETARDSHIAVPTQKTNEFVRIPVNPFICQLIDEYNIENKEPVFLRHNPQVFNRTIKKICEKAGINRIEKVNKTKNSKHIPTEGPKWQFVSSHTMRRTFITILASMTQISNIQAVSGHKDIKVLMDYIKRNDKELNQVRGCFNDVFSRSIKDYFDEKKPTQTAKVRATPVRTDVITRS